LTNSGKRITRTVTTRKTIDSAHARPDSPVPAAGSLKTTFHSECHRARTHEMAV
jgi:hypothetical protein